MKLQAEFAVADLSENPVQTFVALMTADATRSHASFANQALVWLQVKRMPVTRLENPK